jgi:hypothetical protein
MNQMQLRKYFGRPYPWLSITIACPSFLSKKSAKWGMKQSSNNRAKPRLNSIQRRSMMAAGAGQIKIIRHLETPLLCAQIINYTANHTDTPFTQMNTLKHNFVAAYSSVGSNLNFSILVEVHVKVISDILFATRVVNTVGFTISH